MPDDFADSSGWMPSSEGTEGLEDADFGTFVANSESFQVKEYTGPCGSCANCATGTDSVGGDSLDKESSLDIVEVGFKANRLGFYINEARIYLQIGSRVIVEGDHGIELGIVEMTGETVHRKRLSRGIIGQAMGKLLRLANDEDLKALAEIGGIEKNAVSIFKERCLKHNLQMKLITVEFQIDRSRLTFYFTAERRVDFRSLVRDLAGTYHTRIELRQIGARDEAKKLGGLGACGREICCVAWMRQICRVNVDCARYQNISLSPTRLAGTCGRVKCCILFENRNYIDAMEKFPSINARLETTKGICSVERVDVLNNRVLLKYHDTGVIESVGVHELESLQVQNH